MSFNTSMMKTYTWRNSYVYGLTLSTDRLILWLISTQDACHITSRQMCSSSPLQCLNILSFSLIHVHVHVHAHIYTHTNLTNESSHTFPHCCYKITASAHAKRFMSFSPGCSINNFSPMWCDDKAELIWNMLHSIRLQTLTNRQSLRANHSPDTHPNSLFFCQNSAAFQVFSFYHSVCPAYCISSDIILYSALAGGVIA